MGLPSLSPGPAKAETDHTLLWAAEPASAYKYLWVKSSQCPNSELNYISKVRRAGHWETLSYTNRNSWTAEEAVK